MQEFTEFTLDMLTTDSVSVVMKKYIEFGGNKYYTADTRNPYVNSNLGREQIKNVLTEPYLSSVFAVWGNTPTVNDENIESEV